MLRISQIAFSVALIGLALVGLLHQDFCIIIPPSPKTEMKPLFMVGDVLVVLGATCVIVKRYEFIGSLICGTAILLFSYLLKVVPVLAKSSLWKILNSAESWETLGLIGGCMILAGSIKKSNILFKIGLVTETTWFLWAGIGHFMYFKYVVSLIPDYVPFHNFWVYFCGICLMLASIGLWVPKLRVLTAKLAAIMLFLWCVMLHTPNYLTHQDDISRLMGIFESLGFAGIMGMVAFE